ncbi:hypothetical protein [Gallibacterium anatis]|uniref:hypothetical protein n=3 Tax=Gallibacterium anatis TaxID=750 RepID=UPI0030068E9C
MILPNITEELFPIDRFESPEEYFEFFIFEKNTDLLDTPLYDSLARKDWIKATKKLEELPITEKYIEDEKSVALSKVANELKNIDLFLPVNQVLFHQGDFPKEYFPTPLTKADIGKEFSLLEVFSATLDPYIANIHEGSDIHWCISIKGENIRCYPVPCEVQNEYEIIILGSPKVKVKNVVTKERSHFYDENGIELKGWIKTIVFVDLY